MLIRRVVAAIVATLAIYTALALLAGIVLRYWRWSNDQPASRFWPLQWIEGGWLLALSALLVAITVCPAHRRAA